MWCLLLLLLVSCRLEPVETITEPDIIENTLEGIVSEYTLEGNYRRSIGSQFEVYEIADKLRVYIQTGDSMDKIYEADYSYTETDIIIGDSVFPYVLGVDSVTICGYTYYRF